jgi:type II secretory pathway pseudopilin PulG
MSRRTGTSIVETLVVIAIIGIMMALLFPSVQSARTRALELGCKNNLRQINLAIAGYQESTKRLPGPGAAGRIGGWTIDVLPFLEQKNLQDRITPGSPISKTPDFLLRQPLIFRCPMRDGRDGMPASTMDPANYVLVVGGGRKSFGVYDTPLEVSSPWASGLELTTSDIIRQTGPHNRGFFYSGGFQDGVGFVAGGQIIH